MGHHRKDLQLNNRTADKKEYGKTGVESNVDKCPSTLLFFEDSRYFSLMIWEKGTSTYSLPVLKNSCYLVMNSSWIFCISLRFLLAFSRVTPRHSRGGCLRCRSSESERAKKSSQSSQK
jgi:hypothetical protein